MINEMNSQLIITNNDPLVEARRESEDQRSEQPVRSSVRHTAAATLDAYRARGRVHHQLGQSAREPNRRTTQTYVCFEYTRSTIAMLLLM